MCKDVFGQRKFLAHGKAKRRRNALGKESEEVRAFASFFCTALEH
jgi:hypothetical protein